MANMQDLFVDGGRTGALMRAHDWSQSPLGHPADVAAVAANGRRAAAALAVPDVRRVGSGARLSLQRRLRRDPRRQASRARWAAASRDIWSEIWPDISPLIDAAMAGRGDAIARTCRSS